MKSKEAVIEEILNRNCPYCGCKDKLIAKSSGYARIFRGLRSSDLEHIACVNCGLILHSYIEKPEKLLSKREKELL